MQASNHSPLEGESQKPSRQAKADAEGGPTNTRHLAHQHIYTSPAVAPLEGESQKPSRQAKADAVGGRRRAARLRRVPVEAAPSRFVALRGPWCPFVDFFFPLRG